MSEVVDILPVFYTCMHHIADLYLRQVRVFDTSLSIISAVTKYFCLVSQMYLVFGLRIRSLLFFAFASVIIEKVVPDQYLFLVINRSCNDSFCILFGRKTFNPDASDHLYGR